MSSVDVLGSTVVVTDAVCGAVFMDCLEMDSVDSCAALSPGAGLVCSHDLQLTVFCYRCCEGALFQDTLSTLRRPEDCLLWEAAGSFAARLKSGMQCFTWDPALELL